ncbi:FkbM family methyltransferase [Puniceibacterium confluentis]|uniref:FkbM family methyltransferase n=1 Tax=Puniceibacterium confluentis TaxID=1958944 RepID=UPI0011B3A046|nr:FkbM family methyltransferase [Puniceibacterium confluentis]
MIDLRRSLHRRMARALTRGGSHVMPDRMQARAFAQLVPVPDLVVDVGVGRGTPWLYGAFPDSAFLLVDPMHECREDVARLYPTMQSEFVETALGDAPGEAQLNIPLRGEAVRGNMASLLNRSDEHLAKIDSWQTRTVPVTTLDRLLADRPGRIGLKIDTEGAEANILRGATSILPRCDFVVLELSLSHRFEEVAPPSAAIALLAQAGLEMRDVLAVSGSGAATSARHIDALFTRWNGSDATDRT